MDGVISLEGVSSAPTEVRQIYIVLTDTKTTFSKIAKLFTWDDYNHASISLSDKLTTMYTFALGSNGGGFKIEKRHTLAGADYKLYSVSVTEESYRKIRNTINHYRNKDTKYSHKSLINTIMRLSLFNSHDKYEMICSQFVLFTLMLGEVEGVDKYIEKLSKVKPNDFKDMEFITHVRDGSFPISDRKAAFW